MPINRSLAYTTALTALVCGCAPAATVQQGAPAPAGTTQAQSAPAALPLRFAAQPTVAQITPRDLMSRLYTIADDSMMGRQAGHRGNYMATEYIAAEFRRMGLEPAGENGTFFQTIPLYITELAEDAAFSVDGAPLRIGADVVPLPHMESRFTYVPRMQVQNAPVVFGGRLGGAMITDAQAAGKVVVMLPPMVDGQVNYRVWLAPQPQLPSAAAIVVASLDISSQGLRNLPFTISSGLIDPSSIPAQGPAGVLVSAEAARRMLGADPATLQPGAAGRARMSGRFNYAPRPADAPARNVIAVLRGSDPAVNGQYVGISAHNDHEGFAEQPFDHDSTVAYNTVMRPQGANDPVGTPTPAQLARIRALRDSLSRDGTRMDSVYNGADDDGSGTVALLEIAEAMAASGTRPRRSILFISHTAEEAGLLGSQHFSDHPTVPRDSIVTVLNMDMVGHGRAEEVRGGGPYSIQMIGSRRLSTELGGLIDALNGRRTPPMQIDYSWDATGHPANRYCRSDHFMYARYGIPITYFSLGYHPHYHMVTDEAQYIDYDHTARVASFLHDIAAEVANRPGRLVVDGPRQDPNAPCRQ
ncbi:M20/M25/M40 family metallo-hydrolase [Longimicrobium sp.]|uniref:M20/M25/M40 family metallo-hydrolase n=1 Tax=Longimicrobium sp. TaxID=2029185 RepID=UPI003B3A44AD